MRQPRQSSAGARSHPPRPDCGTPGSGGCANKTDSPAVDGGGTAVGARRHRRIRGCIRGSASDAGPGISQRRFYAHQCDTFAAGSGICVCAFTPDRCDVWRGAGVAGFAFRSGRGPARSRPWHSRRGIVAAKGTGGQPGGAFPGSAGLRRIADGKLAESGESGLWL